jgi:hypothetical protein
MNDPTIIFRGQIDGEFEGFDDEVLFKLSNGMYWVQDEYQYWYFYAYCPQVELLNVQGRPHLRVSGQSQMVAVREAGNVIESRINGEFKGWEGDTSYQLANGQVWQQSAHKYKYKYAYSPHAVVYDAGGGHVMRVAGTSAKVRRVL